MAASEQVLESTKVSCPSPRFARGFGLCHVGMLGRLAFAVHASFQCRASRRCELMGVARRPRGGPMPFGSPAFLSPRSSPSSSPFSIPQNTHSTLLASPPPQDTTLASITDESDTPRSPSPPTRHSSLVVKLGKTKTRYDELQRAFRDCHLALLDLSQTLQALSPSSSPSPPSSLPISAL